MEENIKLEVICDYHDIEKDEIIPQGTIRWVTPKRAKQLIDKEVVKLLEIRKCIYESTRTTK